ncbi:type VI secretion system baseplate subunit TssF [Mucilaginibacter sp. 21P]|uniref:type VI secretion system baseplate subunit TssF n=1 Tax=Mucilaginibacter sp. 21P TaxID=2778902 RepID=UPI001C58718F|nr:type VI secretion system baseplate subunit TssF [Mucilaginibacter sp. 21P]QXV65594.1 type VI secretion system baseplate subunit TssF [Mucilaginibacter sp. 21P]
MSSIFYNSKEEIRTRMLRNAMDFWGNTNVNDMDPLVKLLIEALSTEIFNVSNDVKNLESRVLNKISRILASDYLTSALPAHGVLKGQPIENKEVLRINNHFFYRRPSGNETSKQQQEDADVFFSPVGNVKVINAAIKYTVIGKHLYDHQDTSHKSVLMNAGQSPGAGVNTLWIAIDCDGGLTDLKDLSLFFEWPDYTTSDDLYTLLSVVKGYTDDNNELELSSGLKYQDEQAAENRPVFYEQNIINLLTRDIKEYYNKRFLTITDRQMVDVTSRVKKYPGIFSEFFNATDLNRLKPCVWLKFTFPAAMSAAAIDELQLSLNCFPVVNRRLYEQKYRLKDTNNIIPVKPANNELFLSVKDLSDDKNTHYSEIPYTQAEHNYEGSYSIRNGGAERFDSRSAHQLIEYLFELLRDEKAAFASYGGDFLSGMLKTLEQNLALIERKSRTTKDKAGAFNYLIVKPANKAAMLYLQYWTTLADAANNIRRGSKVQQFEMLKLKDESLRLITTTTGGRNSLGATERIQAYKYGLTTKDRIVTQADLISFCYYELGNKITDVKIGKGVVVSQNPKEGFQKTVDIYLRPVDNLRLSAEDWDMLFDLLKTKLISRSVINSHYRFFLN